MSENFPGLGSEPRLNYVTCVSPAGAHRMAYWEWGNPENGNVLLCVHGLTRSGRDFDPLARALSSHYRVVCPDIVGRGRSDWLINPQFYSIEQYVADIFMLIARLNPANLDWVGTSMGGLIGLGLAAAINASATLSPARGSHGLSANQRISLGKMVLNDIGPVINTDGLGRIAEYVGQDQSFNSFDEAIAYIKETSADFGKHDDEGWKSLTKSVIIKDGGIWKKHYDLRIAIPMASQTSQAIKGSENLLWYAFESLARPVLIVRGEHSDLLTPETTRQMLRRNSNASLFTVPDTGHAPTLRNTDQINAVKNFLIT